MRRQVMSTFTGISFLTGMVIKDDEKKHDLREIAGRGW